MMVKYYIFTFASNTTNYDLNYIAIIVGLITGIVMPLISNILPIQKAFSR